MPSEDVSRHIDEVIDAVARGEFTLTRAYSHSPPPLSPSLRAQAKGGRKRQLTTSSSSDSTAPPGKRSAPPTPQSDMKSPPLSATSLDEPQPFSIPNQGEFVLTNPNFIVLDLNVLWEGLNTMTFEGSPCCAIGHTFFMELVVTLLNVLKMHHAEIYVRNLILSRLSQNLRKWFYVGRLGFQ